MLNLIKKNFRASLNIHMKNLVLYIIIAGFIFQFSEEQVMYPYICTLYIITVIFHSIGFIELKKGDILFCSLPVRRSTIVIGKYIYSYIIIVAGMVTFSFYALVLNSLLPDPAFVIENVDKTGILFTSAFVILLLISIAFPLIFRFGIIMGGLISFVFVILFIVVIPLRNHNSAFSGIEAIKKIARSSATPDTYLLLSLGMAGLIVVSVLFSLVFFSKKDL